MKREEKNYQMKRRIMDSALQEFSKHSYSASSMNAISATPGISKGIIYHYFTNKDNLFLACVEESFDELTEFLKDKLREPNGDKETQLENYFSARMNFFAEHPVYQQIFCEAMFMPPEHLEKAIREKRKEFDELNFKVIEDLLESLPLRKTINKNYAIETFRQFQDFINAKYRVSGLSEVEFKEHENQCRRTLNIILYGVIEREKNI